MTKTPTPASHAVNTAPISADLRGMAGLSEQDAGLQGLLSLVRREAPQLSGKVLGAAERAIAALQAAPPAPEALAVPGAEPIAPGMKAAADLVQEQADLYIAEHAETDPDTGAVIWHHRDFGFDWHNGLEELAQKLMARAALAAPPAQAAPYDAPVPGMAVQALAGEIVEALLADEKDGGYDLTAGLFGRAFSTLVRRWAAAEWSAPAQAVAVPNEATEMFMTPAEIDAISSMWVRPGQPAGISAVREIVQTVLGRLQGRLEIRERAARAIRATLKPAPAQEHATQLAGQGPRTPGSFVNAAGIHASDMPATVVRKLDAAFHDAVTFADAPAQAQEDARDAVPVWRTDAEIVEQTEELAKYLLNWKWYLQPESPDAQLRNSRNTQAQAAWKAACEIQELLTATDVENAVAEVDDAARAAQGGAA